LTEALPQFKANVFQALSHPTRIAIVEQLRNGELSAGEIVERLRLEQSNASQHFSVLRAKNVVTSRKEGCQVYYAVRDPLLIEVLDLLCRYFQSHIEETMSMLKAIDQTQRKDAATAFLVVKSHY
jgi:DNA-binding transcriptional ArsR family regulator